MIRKFFILFIIILTFTSCEELILGPQPKFYEEEDVYPSLNVFGVLRPDNIYFQPLPSSFFLVSKIVPIMNDTVDVWYVPDASIFVENADITNETDTAGFFTNDTEYNENQYLNTNWNPKALNTYKIAIYKEGYDSVFAYATVPVKPEIKNIVNTADQIILTLNNDTSIYLYEIFIEDVLFKRKLPDISGNTEIIVKKYLPKFSITIIGYDKNMADYISTMNVFIKPNSFREPFSTVVNGYGCIGALNIRNISYFNNQIIDHN